MFGSDMMIAPVLAPVGSDSSSRSSAEARNGGNKGTLAVASVKVYIPAHSSWVHLWTGQVISAVEGRYVAVDAPIGYPPVFYLPTSVAGEKLREFVLKNGYHAKLFTSVAEIAGGAVDEVGVARVSGRSGVSGGGVGVGRVPVITGAASASSMASRTTVKTSSSSSSFVSSEPFNEKNATSHHSPHYRSTVSLASNKYNFEAIIGVITDYQEPDWAEWLGISQYVSAWNSTYYSLPTDIDIAISGSDEWVPSVHSASTMMGDMGLGSIIDVNAVNVNGNSMMFQDIDVDLSSLFTS